MPAGRPSAYTPEILQKAIEYLDGGYSSEGAVIPSVEGLALFIGKARSTVYEWANHDDKKEFSDILEQILSKQAVLLLNKGLTGEFNSNIAKLALGKHDYKDKAETDLTTDGKSLNLQPVERQAKITAILAKGLQRAGGNDK